MSRRLHSSAVFILFSGQLVACTLLADLNFPTDGDRNAADTGSSVYDSSDIGVTQPPGDTTDARGDEQSDVGPPPDVNYAQTVLADRPSSYWRLGDRSGNAAKDEAGAHSGIYERGFTLGVPGIVPGNTAVHFDGQTGSHMAAGDTFAFPNRASCTLEIWEKQDAADYGGGFLLAKTDDDGTGYALLIAGLGMNAIFFGYQRTSGNDSGAVTQNTPPTSSFVHVVAVYDGFTGHLFLDGVEVAASHLPQSWINTIGSFTVGSNSGGAKAFKGTLDEVAIYDHTLSADRIQAHFLAGTKN